MWPSRSAYTMFCAGTAKEDAASRKLVQSVAVSTSKIASAVVVGVSAVHASEIAGPVPGRASGPVPLGSPGASAARSP